MYVYIYIYTVCVYIYINKHMCIYIHLQYPCIVRPGTRATPVYKEYPNKMIPLLIKFQPYKIAILPHIDVWGFCF